jgi:hypothetical protein
MNRFLMIQILSFGLLGVGSTQAATIYSQTLPSEPIAAFGSSETLAVSQKSADNFSFSAANDKLIRSLRFIGGAGLSEPVADDFRVVFLEDAGGNPGAPLSGGELGIGPAFSRKPTGGQLLNGVITPFEYAINLPNAILLSPKVTYWVSISNSPLPSSGWAWARADGVLDQTTAATIGSIASGPWDTFTTGGMWFELNDHTIPEPSSQIILVLGLIAITVFGDRFSPKRSHW